MFLFFLLLMKIKRILVSFLFFTIPVFAEYQQQGFSQFQESDGNMDFVCENQCVALIGSFAGSDFADLQWSFDGEGIIWYGFLVGQQVVPGETIQIAWKTSINQQFSFNVLQFYSQIPEDAQLVFIAQGNVFWSQVMLNIWAMSFYQKIALGRKDFWKMETLTPYSINLRYGITILGKSFLQYGYRIFVLAILYILVFIKTSKEKKLRMIFFRWIGIFFFIGIRNFVTDIWIVNQWLKNYAYQSQEQKTFFDLGDYISFTDKIRDVLKLDTKKQTCKIFVDSYQDWPFKAHRESLYLKPCVAVLTWSEADYLLYYKKSVTTGDLQKTILVDFNGNYLLQNK